MTTSRGIEGLAKTEKSKLLADLKAKAQNRRDREGPEEAPVVELTPAGAGPKAFDFAQLPQHKQLRMMAAAAELSGIANPFFHIHEGRAGATTLCGNRTLLNFASYNYLGLNGHPEVSAAAKAAIDRYGTTVSASRLVAGERPFHGELEQALARLHGTEAAVVFVSGHATNVSTIGHLMGAKDLILCDALSHNSIVEGARMSGAARLMFPHNDLDALEDLLTRNRSRYERCLIAVEGLYSMDGDVPDLRRLVSIKRRHDAWLLVDEAHSAGVLGTHGRGIAEEQGIDPADIEIWMGTLSKSFAAAGGYIAGSRALIEILKAGAPGFVFSVGFSPSLAGAALKTLEILEREPERVARIRSNARLFLDLCHQEGLDTGTATNASVVPVIIGESTSAVMLSNRLYERGVNVLPIIFPAVPEKQARLRFFITAEHTEAQIREAVAIVADEVRQMRTEMPAWRKLAGKQ
ncbi:aminotransferase class I/II-fold pyridoxal phosphate-dependent enzyme [Prosthecomicrobium sp. N25]|uniref:aminotransferase class I/II-fold pyridoxal phosphate-dependent enzyme n=1 Tax=Prosthecomicrobium sp. N25 TaxID=3129254 RepID=UPI00307746A7